MAVCVVTSFDRSAPPEPVRAGVGARAKARVGTGVRVLGLVLVLGAWVHRFG